MKPWRLLETATTPDGGMITLSQRDHTYSIRIDGHELMSTRQHASEEALATLACTPFAPRRNVRVLVGGLGCGFTLRAALAAVGADAQVVVAELIPAVVTWNRNPAYALGADAVADPRVRIEACNVVHCIAGHHAQWDVILLDVDNGATALSSAANAQLYRSAGLRAARAALRPGGCLGVWSAGADPAFAQLLEQAGFRVEVRYVSAHGNSGQRHALFFGWAAE